MLKNQQPYRDLGADYFDRRNAEQLKRSLIRKLERLGLQVTVEPSFLSHRDSLSIFSRESRFIHSATA